MHGFSTVDGFVEIMECLVEMIRYAANEPSIGLFYIQQHIQNAAPNLASLQKNVIYKSSEAALHTEDSEESFAMVRSMKECRCLIADEMIKDIKKTLLLVSPRQPISGFREEGGFFTSAVKSGKERASKFKWLQVDSKELMGSKGEKIVPCPNPWLCSEGDELPLSSQAADEQLYV